MKTLKIASKSFIILSIISLLYVSIMAFFSPQAVMDLVQVQLDNTDAISSIRGVYGGVGLTLVLTLIFLLTEDIAKALAFLIMLWGFYAISRLITIFSEGALGDFGNQWLVIESLFFTIALVLFISLRRTSAKA